MQKGDKSLTPHIDFTDTKANIEAIADPQEGMVAQQTDSPYVQGRYANGAWVWGGAGGGSVDSVTGDGVDNTDPANPSINLGIGNEEIINPIWDTDTGGWTIGAGWTRIGSEELLHTAGNIAPISQSGSPLFDGKHYKIFISVYGGTAGTLSVDVGTGFSTTIDGTIDYDYVFDDIWYDSGTKVTVTPSSDFDGNLGGVGLQVLGYAQDAVNDSVTYARKNSAWIAIVAAGDVIDSGVIVGQLIQGVTDSKHITAAGIAPNITAGKILTLTAVDNYTLTIPATGTVALLGVENVFIENQTVPTLIVSAPANTALSVASSALSTGNSNGWALYTMRQIINSAALSNTGKVQTRITFKASTTSALAISKAFIGMAAAAGDAYDFAATPTQLTFNGLTTASCAAGETIISDWVSFSVEAAKNLIISIYHSGVSGYKYEATESNWHNYYKNGDDAATVNAVGYADGGASAFGVSLVEALDNDTALQVVSLSSDSGVYTNSTSHLTTTPPISGILGYWSRGVGTYLANLTDNLGLGTTTPTAKFDVVSPGGTLPFSFWQQSSGSTITLIQMQIGATVPNTVGYLSSYSATKEINLQGVYGLALTTGAIGVGNLGLYIDAAGKVGITTLTPSTRFHVVDESAVTNAVVNVATLENRSTGTAASGLGAALLLSLETATASTNKNAGRFWGKWITPTNGSETSAVGLDAYYNSTAQEFISGEATSGGVKLGLYGVTRIARPTTSSAAATFSQLSGNAVNDASTFDGYTLNQVVKALRDIGILT
jgi:hypothetical protein